MYHLEFKVRVCMNVKVLHVCEWHLSATMQTWLSAHNGREDLRHPPRLPGWETEDDDSLWKLVSIKKPGQKPTVLYIGGLSPSTSDDKLTDFVKKRAQSAGHAQPKIYIAKIFRKIDDEQDSICGARVTIDERSAELLSTFSFWPGRIYARPSNFIKK